MKNFLKISASALTVLAIGFAVVATTNPVSAFEFPFGFGDKPEPTVEENPEPVTESVLSSSRSFTECVITASRDLVAVGDEVTLNWRTSGFRDLTINDEPISEESGSRVFSNIRENTTYILKGTNDSGSNCEAKVRVGCKPPAEVKECKMEVSKSVNKSNALPGEELEYTITVSNVGQADCTGGGVKIEDQVDPALSYVSAQLSSNLSAGYHNSPIYTENNRTLHVNGNTLNPGEVGTITLLTQVAEPSACGDFEVSNQAKATAKELNNFQVWSYSDLVKTAINNDCDTEPAKATVVVSKIVCTDESQLPNYGKLGGPNMTADTAAAWVADHDTCSLQSGFEFEWTDTQGTDPGDTLTGQAGSPWNAFGPTGTDGMTSVEINLDDLVNDQVWFREVLQTGYIPFTHGQNAGTNVDDVSAEFYCHTDVVNYDNYDFIKGMTDGQTYHCVAWNSPVPETPAPTCDMFTATPGTIMVGSSSTLSWETSHANEVFINNGIGAVVADGSIDVSPLSDIVYILTAIGADDKSVECEVPVVVSIDSVPACEFFTATPNSLPTGGGSVTLDWKTVNAGTASITPAIGVVPVVGSKVINVTESATYTLTATDSDGDEVSCQAPVVVADPSPTLTCKDNVSFSVSDSSIKRGDSTTLNWSTTNVDLVSISGINAKTLSGNQSVSPSSDVTYVLTATRGDDSVSCPVSVSVSSGGGGGGSVSPRCELKISDAKISAGEKVTLTWDSTNASDVTLTGDRGEEIFSTRNYLSNEKKDYYDGSITLSPTRDTKYTLLVERGSREEECDVSVDLVDDLVVLQTRDQQPLVAGIALSQVPYTGFEAGPVMTLMFYILLIAWSLYITYMLVARKRAVSNSGAVVSEPAINNDVRPGVVQSTVVEAVTKGVAVPLVSSLPTAVIKEPANLPTGTPTIGYMNFVGESEPVTANPHQATDAVVTELENRAHEQKALLSSDAVRYFIGKTSGLVERNESLDEIIAEAKKNYPLEDGWIVINEARMRNLCEVCKSKAAAATKTSFVPATIPDGSGSLAEAIVTGNVVAAFLMIGNRPMFAIADAAADLDAVYRNRKGGQEVISDVLSVEAAKLSDEQIKNMIKALTSAIDGTYTDEISAVKMAIVKAVKEVDAK